MKRLALRCLHVNDYRHAGGCEVLVEQTMRLLRDRGVECDLFTSADVPGHRRTALTYIASRRCRLALRGRLSAYRPDVVHLHNFYHELSPAILAELAGGGARVVMTAHDYHLLCPNSGLCACRDGVLAPVAPDAAAGPGLLSHRWDHRGAAHSALKVAQHAWNYRLLRRQQAIDVVICPSRFMQRAIEGLGLRSVFAPNPSPRIDTVPAPRDHGLHWVFAGRIEPEKGLLGFLRDLPADWSGRMTIVGDGTQRGACEEVCSARGFADRVTFTGSVPPAEARAIIATAHVLVLPSVTPENAPLVLLEALALGATILVSDRGGMREIVESSGAGWAYDVGKPETLVRAVGEITDRHAMGTLLQLDVSAFLEARSEGAYVEAVLDVYRD